MPLGFERRAAAQESETRAAENGISLLSQGLGSLAQGTGPIFRIGVIARVSVAF